MNDGSEKSKRGKKEGGREIGGGEEGKTDGEI